MTTILLSPPPTSAATVIDLADHDAWLGALRRAGVRDVYYLPEYHRLYGFLDGRCLAYAASLGGETLFYPFVLRPIRRVGAVALPPGLHDIQTVYGYTGPVATSAAPEFLAEAWRGFEAWCSDHGVVCEFIRFNPLLRTERFAAPEAEVRLDRETVEVRLGGGEDELWHSYEPAQRNRVRRALKSGLVCEEEGDLGAGLPAFRRLYEETMRRVGAPDFYLFPDGYYEALARALPGHARLFTVRHRGDAIAAAVFLTDADAVHYHLGGSSAAALPLAPNNLLFHEVALWARRRGFRRLHLGGGRSSAADDPLLRFKRRLSRHTLPFYLGRRVHDPQRYGALCELWMEQAAGPAPPAYFPLYRVDPAAAAMIAGRGGARA